MFPLGLERSLLRVVAHILDQRARGHAACTTALIDRVVHHADIIPIEGESYRRRDAQADKRARRSSKKDAA